MLLPVFLRAQQTPPEFSAPAPAAFPAPAIADSTGLPFGTRPTVPRSYEDLMADELGYDLSTPSNITTTADFDATTGNYIVRTYLGGMQIGTPFMLTAKQYENWQLRLAMQKFYKERNLGLITDKEKEPFNILDMNFALGPLEKIFGPGGVSLKTQGSVQVSMGIKSNKTDNPALSLSARRKTYFDFDQKIQATIAASVGNRLRFNMTYNTDATPRILNWHTKARRTTS